MDEKIIDEINPKIDSTKIQVNVELDETLVVSTNKKYFAYHACNFFSTKDVLVYCTKDILVYCIKDVLVI